MRPCATREGRAFDSIWSSEFFIDLIFPGDSATNRNQSTTNDYQAYLLNDKGGRCVGLTTMPPSCAVSLEVLGEPEPPGA